MIYGTFQVTVAMRFGVPGGKAGINAPIVTTSMIKGLSVELDGLGLSENVGNTPKPNGFADHYPCSHQNSWVKMDVHPTKNGIFIGIDPYPYGCGSKWKTINGTTDVNV